MKHFKRLLLICVFFCMAGVGFSLVYCSLQLKESGDDGKADFTLSNIEALAYGEGNSTFCYGKGSVYCAGRYVEMKIDTR